MLKRISAFLTIFLILLPHSVVYATDGFGDFDPEYYAERYPDIKEAFGDDDPYALYSHYLDLGIDEGRFPNKEAEIKQSAGETYIDIDIENQLVTYYENGFAVYETPCVSGDVDGENETPTGTYEVYAKVKGKYLKGPTWNVWVDYWMPFNSSIGLHDATWRSKFGGEIYKTGGSHGCVNIPHKAAGYIFKRIKVGTPVIVR